MFYMLNFHKRFQTKLIEDSEIKIRNCDNEAPQTGVFKND